MDPVEAMLDMIDGLADGDTAEAGNRADDLLTWLQSGGGSPLNIAMPTARSERQGARLRDILRRIAKHSD